MLWRRISPFSNPISEAAFCLFVLLLFSIKPAAADDEPLVFQNIFGNLVYSTYANRGQTDKVNVVPDYSRAGYKGGGIPIPFIPAAIILSDDGPADDTARIQNAIDTVAGIPIGADGFRGAVLLSAGEYQVSSQLHINDSGIVLRGEGSQEAGGTRIVFTSTAPADETATLIGVDGGGTPSLSSFRNISDSYVPVGAKSFRVEDVSLFSPGDMIRIRRKTNAAWIMDLGMDAYGWTADNYPLSYERVITTITGNAIHVDAPVMQVIEDRYGGGEIALYSHPAQIRNVGIEALRFESAYTSDSDENHGWNAIVVSDARDVWVRQVTAQYFAYACVYLKGNSHFITVQDSANLDAKSQITGGRRYSFVANDASYFLFQRNYARRGRHDFVTHSQTPGPHVFVDSRADDSYADTGPHHRYAFGGLYDNIMNRGNIDAGSAGRIDVQNRRTSGTGHGWAGAQIMLWNNDAHGATVDAPPGAMNWSVGFIGKHEQGRWPPAEPDGIWQSEGAHVTPRSLYYKQLEQRMGTYALHSVVLPRQLNGHIWGELKTWAGNGLLLDEVVAWHESDVAVPENTVRLRSIVRNLQVLDRGFSVAWTKVSGPGDVIFDQPGSLETNAGLSEPGVYSLKVTIDDGITQRSALVEVDTGFRINAFLNDAWVNSEAPYQGMFITVFPDLKAIFIAWFSFDSGAQPVGGTAVFGAADQRWVTGLGTYSENTAIIDVELSTGGLFNASEPPAGQTPGYGSITISFANCNEAALTYEFPALQIEGQMTLNRAVPENKELCEAFPGS